MTAERIRNRLNAELQRLKHLQLFRQHRVTESLPDGRCRVDERTLINFGSNDYLNLAHEVMQSEHIRELASQGLGATGSELLTGHSEWHEQLEHALAEFEGTEAAVLFPSGFSANIGVLQSLVTSADAVFCDRDNHASLIDGARCSDGEFFVFRGDRPEVLERSLARRRSQFDQVLIVTDGVFSMDGRVADLNALCDIAERHDALVIVDEAHGTGVLGANGRGATEVCGVEHRVFLRIGTLSKALGGLGGFAVSDHITIDWLRNSARSRFFSTALPPLICAAMLESLRVVDEQPERRARLRELTDFANSEIRRLGLNSVGSNSLGPNTSQLPIAPILSVIIPSESSCLKCADILFENGVLCPAIRPPTVRSGTSRLRLSLKHLHKQENIETALEIVKAVLAG